MIFIIGAVPSGQQVSAARRGAAEVEARINSEA
jgi:hypothetical protein